MNLDSKDSRNDSNAAGQPADGSGNAKLPVEAPMPVTPKSNVPELGDKPIQVPEVKDGKMKDVHYQGSRLPSNAAPAGKDTKGTC